MMIKKHIGLFRQMPLSTSDEKVAEQVIQTRKYAKAVENYFRHHGRHIWDVQCKGYVMRGDANTNPPSYARYDIAKYMQENDMQGFEPNYFTVHGGWNASYCGLANVGGNRSVTFLRVNCGLRTTIHELGHNFGLKHASTLQGDKFIEYGDDTSIMGSPGRIVGLNSPQVIQLGFETERETKRITSSEQVLITPIEMSRNGMHESEFQNIIVGNIYISLRKIKGTPYPVRPDKETLYIHELKERNKFILHIPDLMPGESKEVNAGLKIEYLEYSGETARVNIIIDGIIPTDIDMTTGLPPKLPGATIEDKHSGLWHNKDFNGQGIDLHVKGNRFVLYWYTYNVNQNSRRFYFGSGLVTDDDFDILTTEDGTWDDPTTSTERVVGKAQIQFFDESNGLFTFDTEEHARGSIELTPVITPLEQHPSSGSYYQESRNGEGVTVQIYESINTCVAFWFSYGPGPKYTLIGRNYKGNIRQRWYVCTGVKVDGVYNLTVYEVVDGTWMKLSDGLTEKNVGTVKLEIIDNNNITWQYNINADRLAGAGKFDLKRLF